MQEIIPYGAFFSQTEDGYVKNPCSLDVMDKRFLEVIPRIVKSYVDQEGENLHSVYLRGSIPRGMALGDCDLDTFALVYAEGDRWRVPDWASAVEEELNKTFQFLTEVEIYLASYTAVLNSLPNVGKKVGTISNPNLAMMIKTQSLCIYGQDISPHIPMYKPDVSMMLDHPWLAEDLSSFEKDKTNLVLRQQLLKTIIRSGFELVMPKIKQYTPDLYLCFKSFAGFYPEKEEEMRQVLFDFLNPPPIENPGEGKLIIGFGRWLCKQFE